MNLPSAGCPNRGRWSRPWWRKTAGRAGRSRRPGRQARPRPSQNGRGATCAGADPVANSSFLRGARKLDKIKWALTISRAEGFDFSNRYVKVASGSEEHFLVKLKAGSYHFDQLVAQGFANFYFLVDARFDVTPKTVTYIGKLEITIPYRMYSGPIAFNLLDNQEETVAALRDNHPELEAEVGKALMQIAE